MNRTFGIARKQAKMALIWSATPLILVLVMASISSLYPVCDLPLICLTLFGLIVWAFAVVASIVRFARQKEITMCFVYLVLLVIILPAMRLCLQAGDYVHVVVLYPQYWEAINDPVNYLSPIEFRWQPTGGFGGSSVDRTLEYDRDDKLATQVGSTKMQDNPEIWATIKHLFGHFYLYETTYN